VLNHLPIAKRTLLSGGNKKRDDANNKLLLLFPFNIEDAMLKPRTNSSRGIYLPDKVATMITITFAATTLLFVVRYSVSFMPMEVIYLDSGGYVQ
jgi:hypothetical protein